MTVLITAASGQLGRLAIDALLARGVPAEDIRAGARTPAKLAGIAAGVQVVELDYDRPATIAAAVEGADAVLLISSNEVGRRVAQHRAVIDAAVAAGVERFAYTSAPFATTSQLILAPEHKATEEAIAASGLAATILRNNWYTENYAGAIGVAAATGVLLGSAGSGSVASASRADFAAAAAAVLIEPGHLGQVYELAGDTAWTLDELAAAMSTVTGAAIEYRDVTTEEHIAALVAAGVDAGTAGFLAGIDANIKAGDLAFTDGTLARLIARPTTPLVDGLKAAVAGPS